MKIRKYVKASTQLSDQDYDNAYRVYDIHKADKILDEIASSKFVEDHFDSLEYVYDSTENVYGGKLGLNLRNSVLYLHTQGDYKYEYNIWADTAQYVNEHYGRYVQVSKSAAAIDDDYSNLQITIAVFISGWESKEAADEAIEKDKAAENLKSKEIRSLRAQPVDPKFRKRYSDRQLAEQVREVSDNVDGMSDAEILEAVEDGDGIVAHTMNQLFKLCFTGDAESDVQAFEAAYGNSELLLPVANLSYQDQQDLFVEWVSEAYPDVADEYEEALNY